MFEKCYDMADLFLEYNLRPLLLLLLLLVLLMFMLLLEEVEVEGAYCCWLCEYPGTAALLYCGWSASILNSTSKEM